MICPHCKAVIKRGPTPEAIKRAKEMQAKGYSLREMERLLFAEGIHVSFASLSRALSPKKKAKK